MKKKLISIGLILILFIGVIYAWNVGYLSDIKAVFRSETTIDKQEKNQKESNNKSTNENNELSTVGMNEAYIAEKVYDDERRDEHSRRWQIKATDCHISRELDFDVSIIGKHRVIQNEHKESMDSNMNFLKDYYYVTVELDVTNMNEENWEWSNDIFNPNYWIFYMDDEIGRIVMEEPYGRIYENKDMSDPGLELIIDKGETVHIILYYIVEDKYTKGQMYMSMRKDTRQLDEPDILLKETR